MGTFPYLDIEQVLKQQLPNVTVPRPVIWLMKKLIHQDWMNRMLRDYNGGAGMEFAHATVRYLNETIVPHGFDKLDASKKYIFVSNHPLGGPDGITMATVLDRKWHGVKFLVNEFLYYLIPLRPLIVPVKMGGGTQKREQAIAVDQALRGDDQFIIFPSGQCSRFHFGSGIHDREWKKSFISFATKYHRDVVPCYYDGHNHFGFYALSWLRTHLGIKLNLEMTLLIHEMYRNQGKTFNVYFGDPIPWQELEQARNPMAKAAQIRSLVYDLPKQK